MNTRDITVLVRVNDDDYEVHAKLVYNYEPAQPAYFNCPGRNDCPAVDESLEVGIVDAYRYNHDGEKIKFSFGPILELCEKSIKEEILAECVE